MSENLNCVYYYGEFGYFNFIILGYLEEYFAKNKKSLVIQTYDDYFKILSLKFPNKFIKPSKKIETPDRFKRRYHKIENDNFNKYLIREGWTPLEKFLDCDIENWKEGRKRIKNIKKPIIIKSETKKNYVSFLCRNRFIDKDRNLSLDAWHKIINNIKKIYENKKIIFHGLKEETTDVEGYSFCSDILESIEYLNQSILFVSSMSGFAQFASNCGCNILQIGPSFQMIPYNPFDKVNIQIERNDIDSIESQIRKQFLKQL